MNIDIDELIVRLEVIFPDRCPHKGTKIEDIYFDAGSVAVVTWIKQEFKIYTGEAIPNEFVD